MSRTIVCAGILLWYFTRAGPRFPRQMTNCKQQEEVQEGERDSSLTLWNKHSNALSWPTLGQDAHDHAWKSESSPSKHKVCLPASSLEFFNLHLLKMRIFDKAPSYQEHRLGLCIHQSQRPWGWQKSSSLTGEKSWPFDSPTWDTSSAWGKCVGRVAELWMLLPGRRLSHPMQMFPD